MYAPGHNIVQGHITSMAAKKILIIDDDEELVEELKDMLVSSGYDVTGLTKSISAIEVTRAANPDLILLDLKMNEMSGFEVADALKHLPETSHIPIIAMTGFYVINEPSWLMNFYDIKKCLKKPFSPQDVITRIEEVFSKRG